jgi:1-deoxy-D-xylulose-5-phosphate reductoisomerase
MTGAIGIAPTAAAIQSKKNICLANKEVLVSGGRFITSLAKQHGVALIPIDSELTAIFQCLQGRNLTEIERIVITASGGPFLHRSHQSLSNISVEEAMQHPNWKMGPKVTIDSSTMMNKGFEAIEAHFLFDLPFDKIDIVVHPQSIIHGMVEFIDGSILAQLSDHDMLFPVQYALTHPRRSKIAMPRFDFTKHGLLQFFAPDPMKFPCLHLAKAALQTGGSAPCYLNGANEILVHRFLQKEIPWTGIAEKLTKLLDRHVSQPVNDLQSILEIDKQARKEALQA